MKEYSIGNIIVFQMGDPKTCYNTLIYCGTITKIKYHNSLGFYGNIISNIKYNVNVMNLNMIFENIPQDWIISDIL